MAERVEITWPSSGVECYSKTIEEISGGQSKPYLKSVSNISRAINESKNFENSSIEIVLSNLNDYFSLKMSGADQYIKDAVAEYYIDDILFFKGQISRLPKCNLEEFRIVVDTNSAELDLSMNQMIKKEDFPNVPAENEGKYGNLIYGTADDTDGAGEGMLAAYRIDDGKYLACWHEVLSFISVFDANGSDISSLCTFDTGRRLTDGGLEDWASATNLTSWTESVSGSSTVNQESSEVYDGDYSCRFDVDGSENNAQITQNLSLIASAPYKISFWHKTPIGASVHIRLRNSLSNVFLTADGSWAASAGFIEIEGTGEWTKYEIDFLAHASYTAYLFLIGRGATGTASKSIYVDKAEIMGRAYIFFPDSSNDLEVYFNAYGRSNNGVIIDNPATILNRINEDWGSFVIDGISDAEEIYTARAYADSAIIINSDLRWGEFFKNLSVNFDCLIFKQANGNVKIKVLEWGTQESSFKLPKQFISDYMYYQNIEEITDEYKRMYWFHFRKNYFHRLPADVEDESLWAAKPDNIDLRYVKGDETSRDITAGVLFFKKNKLVWHQAKGNLGKMIGLDLGDVISIQYGRGLYPDEYRMVQIYRIGVNGAARWMEIEGLDISEINNGLITLLDSEDSDVHLLMDEGDSDVGILL